MANELTRAEKMALPCGRVQGCVGLGFPVQHTGAFLSGRIQGCPVKGDQDVHCIGGPHLFQQLMGQLGFHGGASEKAAFHHGGPGPGNSHLRGMAMVRLRWAASTRPFCSMVAQVT